MTAPENLSSIKMQQLPKYQGFHWGLDKLDSCEQDFACLVLDHLEDRFPDKEVYFEKFCPPAENINESLEL